MTLTARAGLLALLLALPTSLSAQRVGGSVGLAVPSGALAETRDVGWRIQGSLYSPGGRLRLDVARVAFPGSDLADSASAQERDYSSVSVAGNFLPVITGSETMRLRALVGLSAHRVSVPGVRNPYGLVAGAQLGGVVERTWSRRAIVLESGLHLIASDHGLGELDAGFFIPVGIGVRW